VGNTLTLLAATYVGADGRQQARQSSIDDHPITFATNPVALGNTGPHYSACFKRLDACHPAPHGQNRHGVLCASTGHPLLPV